MGRVQHITVVIQRGTWSFSGWLEQKKSQQKAITGAVAPDNLLSVHPQLIHEY
jgi:hypothetical protein